MLRVLLLFLCLSLFTAPALAQAKGQDKGKDPSKPKELSGMSIVGNDEAPKSLYIVPWKSSELGVETSLNMMLSEDDAPVDRDVFMRQLEFYEVSTAKSGGNSSPK
ncbi:MAG: hypothetical protein P8Z70_06560 [Desulfuromonadales bacterium]|jgi:hypothetical protein